MTARHASALPMTGEKSIPITTVLNDVANGEEGAHERLFELVFQDMREIASKLMRDQPVDHTLQPTAVVNEAIAPG